MVVAVTELHPWRCANPACPSRRTGRGQIVMKGENRLGWRGEGFCHSCKQFTAVFVTPVGVEYSVRPAKNGRCVP